MKQSSGRFPLKKAYGIVALDAILLPLSLWAAFALRFSHWWPTEIHGLWWLFLLCPLLAIPVFVRWGLYRAVLIYMSAKAFFATGAAVSLHVLLLFFATKVLAVDIVPVTVFLIYWFVSLALVGGSRMLARGFLQWQSRPRASLKKVAIYGAGAAGAELAETLQAGHEFFPVALIDDKHELHGSEIRGLKVYPTRDLDELIDRCGIEEVLLAIPSAPRVRRQAIIEFLQSKPVHVRTVPDLAEIVSGRAHVSELKAISIEDILGREPIPPNEQLLTSCITGKCVMVTGAGGSIGSELCRQIIKLRPRRLVLFEACEFALYSIDMELKKYRASRSDTLWHVKIIPLLGTVTNQRKVELVITTFGVNTLYHAAAYKHVPLVEYNPIEGAKNNVLGTWRTAAAAGNQRIEAFVLISTDKAVRPTNVMGATKRLAELVVQGLAKQSHSTRFSIVRFGNVLGSSGSVVPLFKQQIQSGGPITLTHHAMTRYFMTIPEAAQLVIQAGAMGRDGDVFVLDMGKPVRIEDLARRMVNLSGLSVRDNDNPNGDIEIEITDIRPGEKLYEELLLGDDVTITDHPRIMRAREVELPWQRIVNILDQLGTAINRFDSDAVRNVLISNIAEYKPQGGIEDPIWLSNQKTKVPPDAAANDQG